MPRLDDRLKVVAKQIRSPVHADIGSDHGHLLKALLTAGRIERGIAIENKQQPYLNSRATLDGLPADVRLADGLDGLQEDEADSLSICGIGGEAMVRILEKHPRRLPSLVILQPNRRPEILRRWGLENGFHLADEQIALGHWAYVILRFEKVPSSTDSDDAYEGLDREAAILLGPHLLRRYDPDFAARLCEEQRYLQGLKQLNPEAAMRRDIITRVLASTRKTVGR